MTLLSRLRYVLRNLPVGGAAARRLSTPAFQASAYVRHGWSRKTGVLNDEPVVVVGFHDSVLGLGDGVRAFSAVLRRAGIEVVDWDIAEVFGHDRHLGGGTATVPPAGGGPMIVHLNPREMVQLAATFGRAPFAGRRVIGYWAWELEQIPRVWSKAFRYVDEVWTPSNFVAEAVRNAAPPNMPVRVFPHIVSLLPQGVPDRARFGLPEDRFTCLISFDVRSGFVRKNPSAALQVIRRASELAQAPVTIVCKVAGREGAPDLFAALRAEAETAGDVVMLTDWLSGEGMASLIASVDVVVSLHRSEGFGLLPAQAMGMGKPVVATGWSGNLDFMDHDSARLVDYDLVPVEDVQGLYAGGHWAEPDPEDAARKLARLMQSPFEREALGVAAAQTIRDRLDPDKWGEIARVWLGRD